VKKYFLRFSQISWNRDGASRSKKYPKRLPFHPIADYFVQLSDLRWALVHFLRTPPTIQQGMTLALARRQNMSKTNNLHIMTLQHLSRVIKDL
jgi:hypothetical protein